MTLEITHKGDALRFEVLAKPRARRSAIGAVAGGVLSVAIAAPPVDGAANEELVRVLAKAISVPRRQIFIRVGEGSKHKVVEVTGVPEPELRGRLALAAG
jgi:hypothetical protein